MTQTELLEFATNLLERLGIPYAIVGSFATAVWGDARMTRDIDIVVQLTSELTDKLCDAFPADDFYVSRPAAHEAVAQRGQFNVIHFRSSNKIDFMIAGRSEWAVRQLTRRRRVQFGAGIEGFVAAPEDVIIGKLVYYQDGGSEKHLRDIAGILSQDEGDLDRRYIAEVATLLGLTAIWDRFAIPDDPTKYPTIID
ncbi:nucleotidyl transferase AbiEii/AbiGii toxin family protein [Lacipirellula parvula]|uniref:Uncharacterized protein n=1 Tax=Lacipirellula parvula TaxID=2650471 RepID=A0A5K7X5L2_9BACT|nr:nucleotidyl transferase AbiEii/AbiGii toxin family protein [Lacipirellula parvula]BBO32014.1 hypothetical protein PLANPX_1626 [Lacipirellula parvula]